MRRISLSIDRVFGLLCCCVLLLGERTYGFVVISASKDIDSVAFSLYHPCLSVSTLYSSSRRQRQSCLFMAQISETEARNGIDKVVAALRKDKKANTELGRLEKVTNILGFGSPKSNEVALRFNASFRKAGMGRSSVPLPFGLGQSNVSEGRGTMVGQVKASVDSKTGRVLQCSVFRDLGYGRSFDLKV